MVHDELEMQRCLVVPAVHHPNNDSMEVVIGILLVTTMQQLRVC
jgi:hypothetical protein